MIIVTIHLHSAQTGKMTQLGQMVITNDDTGTAKQGNYDANIRHGIENTYDTYNGMISRKPNFMATVRNGRLEKHPRLALTIWHLVARMLQNMGYTK